MKLKKLYDINSGEITTIDELKTIFDQLKAEEPEEYNYSFTQYIDNCIGKNG